MTRYLKLRPSVILAGLLFFAYLIALLAVIVLPIVVAAKFLLATLLLCALAYYFCNEVWLILSWSAVAIRLEDASVTVLTRGGNEYTGKVLGDSVVTSILTILHVSLLEQKKLRHVIIFQDSMDREDFRELRVRLKWES